MEDTAKMPFFPICAFFVASKLIWEVEQRRAWCVLAWVTTQIFT